MAILLGFAPWIVYWVLVGNVPFAASGLVALVVAVLAVVVARATRASGQALELGAAGTFLVLVVLTFTVSQSFLERWMLPLSYAGLFVVTLTGTLTGKPVVQQHIDQPTKAVESEPFVRMLMLLTWGWLAVFAALTVSSAIPPLFRRDATIFDTKETVSFLCYWIVPVTLFALLALGSRILAVRMAGAAANVAHKTTFVAYSEATIDELYYLATEHAKREVGAGKDIYDVKVGGAGTPLVGDDSRQSWPATYKTREG